MIVYGRNVAKEILRNGKKVNKIIMRKYGVSIVIILLILFATNFCVKNIWEIMAHPTNPVV